MMFAGKDRQTLQTLINNGTITQGHQKTPWQVLDAIMTSIKSKDHFWHFHDEFLLDVCQHPNEGIHALNTWISTLVNQCKFFHNETKKMLKIMVLQHVVRNHEAQDWIWFQDQSQLTYSAILTHFQVCSSLNASSIERPRRRARLTSPPSLLPPPQCPPPIRMPQRITNDATPTPWKVPGL